MKKFISVFLILTILIGGISSLLPINMVFASTGVGKPLATTVNGDVELIAVANDKLVVRQFFNYTNYIGMISKDTENTYSSQLPSSLGISLLMKPSSKRVTNNPILFDAIRRAGDYSSVVAYYPSSLVLDSYFVDWVVSHSIVSNNNNKVVVSYKNDPDGPSNLYLVNSDKSRILIYNGRTYNTIVMNPTSDYVYFKTDANAIYRIKYDGTELLKIGSLTGEPYAHIPSKNILIYYVYDSVNYKYVFYSANATTGANRTPIYNGNSYGSVYDVSDNYLYYNENGKTYRCDLYGNNIELLFNFAPLNLIADYGDNVLYYTHTNANGKYSVYRYSLNDPPELTLSAPMDNAAYVKEVGLSNIAVEGFVRDPDGDNVTVSATLGGVTKSIVITNPLAPKSFKIEFDAITDAINEGNHTITVTAKDVETSVTKTKNIIIKKRMKHDAYILLNTPISYDNLIYQDFENDNKYQEQFRVMHDPNYFENSLGLFANTGVWSTLPQLSFSLTGKFEATYRASDNPKNVAAFNDFKKWSLESLSMINFYVHRLPVPVGVVTTSARDASTCYVTASDNSYDSDHQTASGKGIYAREWEYKNVNDSSWTGGKPPIYLPNNNDYVARLRVRDIDGTNGIGVWSDWQLINFSTRGARQTPVALFTLSSSVVSHKSAITATNLSYSPSGHGLTGYEWIITRVGGTQIGSPITTSVPTSAELKQGGLGNYSLQLRVRDSVGWSETYTLKYDVINYPPDANFTIPEDVFRDTAVTPVNTTIDKDGDSISYAWYLNLNGVDYQISTAQGPSFTIQQFITSRGITALASVSGEWYLKLMATDSLGASSTVSKYFSVVNQIPIAVINGPNTVGQYTDHVFSSGSSDHDTADNPLTINKWRHTKPDGTSVILSTKDITITFDDAGTHNIEHWVIDQIGEPSIKVSKSVVVVENAAPSMTITVPSGTLANPTIVPSNLNLQWTYSDAENDPQENYGFDFYVSSDDVLFKSMSEADPTGNTRNRLFANDFLKSVVYKVLGRTYSNHKWSEISNAAYFMINTPPQCNITSPSSVELSNPTIVHDLKPTFLWTYDDYDDHPQQQFRLYVYRASNNQVVFDSGIVTSANKTYTLTSNLLENVDYYVQLVVFDGYEWSEMSSRKYFKVITNRPPTVSFTAQSPTTVYEGDSIRNTILPIDADGDRLTIQYYVAKPGQALTLFKTYTNVAQGVPFVLDDVVNVDDGNYQFRVVVNDGNGGTGQADKTVPVAPFEVTSYSLLPNDPMAGDMLYFNVATTGFVDKIEIILEPSIVSSDNRFAMGYNAVNYVGNSIVFPISPVTLTSNKTYQYIAWVNTPQSVTLKGVRNRAPYTFTIRAWRGALYKDYLITRDIKGDVRQTLKMGIGD